MKGTASPLTLKRYIERDSPLGLYLGQVASDILLMFFLSFAKPRLDLRASGLQCVKKAKGLEDEQLRYLISRCLCMDDNLK
jgi:hypothetical protein